MADADKETRERMRNAIAAWELARRRGPFARFMTSFLEQGLLMHLAPLFPDPASGPEALATLTYITLAQAAGTPLTSHAILRLNSPPPEIEAELELLEDRQGAELEPIPEHLEPHMLWVPNDLYSKASDLRMLAWLSTKGGA